MGAVRELPLANSDRPALVDAGDFDRCARRVWYVQRRADDPMCVRGDLGLLHRVIMCPPDHLVVDHINGDVLDNRRCNLRVCTVGQNTCNRGKPKNNKTGFKGVRFDPIQKSWVVQVRIGGVKHRRRRHSLLDAARTYDELARQLHGEFARLNFPLGNP